MTGGESVFFLLLMFHLIIVLVGRVCVLDAGAVPRGEVPGRLPPDRLCQHAQA